MSYLGALDPALTIQAQAIDAAFTQGVNSLAYADVVSMRSVADVAKAQGYQFSPPALASMAKWDTYVANLAAKGKTPQPGTNPAVIPGMAPSAGIVATLTSTPVLAAVAGVGGLLLLKSRKGRR